MPDPKTPQTPRTPPPPADLTAELDDLLAQVPAPLAPLDLSALDGFLVGVLLQPKPVAPPRWLPWVSDEEGRALPARWPHAQRLQDLVLQRYATLNQAIEQRQWFDPWLFDISPETAPHEAVEPWVLGFATACGLFPDLTEGKLQDHPEFNEALAQLYQHLDPQDLEDADELIAEIETLEPPQSMEEAVESLVRGCLLLADISRPTSARAGRSGGPNRAAGSKSAPGHRSPSQRRPKG